MCFLHLSLCVASAQSKARGEARWQLLEPAEGAPRPAKRYGHSAVVDAASRRLLVFGGNGQSPVSKPPCPLSSSSSSSSSSLLFFYPPPPAPSVFFPCCPSVRPPAGSLFSFRGFLDNLNDVWAFGLEAPPRAPEGLRFSALLLPRPMQRNEPHKITLKRTKEARARRRSGRSWARPGLGPQREKGTPRSWTPGPGRCSSSGASMDMDFAGALREL